MKIFLLLTIFSFLFFHSYAAIFDCNSTSDAAGNSSTRTLRYCITQANLTAAADIINFSVSGTFTVGSNYPTIAFPLTINGYSAPGAVQGALGGGTRVLTVVLNGPGNSTVHGFNITASNCEISGLVLQDFSKGVYIDGGDNNWIWGCYIGTAANGLSIAASTTCYDDGISLNTNANNNIIGTNGNGTNDANEGNLIAGNGDSGVQYTGEGIAINEFNSSITGSGTITNDCTGNRIAGNYLGTNETGTTALYPGTTADAQRGSGIQINYSTANIIGTNADGVSDALERNLISGNSDCGIVFAGATGNKIKGNYIGTTKTGLVGLPNYGNEGTKLNAVQITIKLASNNNFIGTDGDGTNDNVEGNIFGSLTIANGSGNISYNYAVFNSASTGNRYSGNYFGIGADGITALNINTTSGPYVDKCIYISSSSSNTIVGTNGDGVSDAIEANYFGNSGMGVAIDNSNSCIVAGNYFGLGTNLTTSEPLTTAGTYILNSSSCRIGSSASNTLERNYFCNSDQYGVWIERVTSNNDLNVVRYNTVGLRPDNVAAANKQIGILISSNTNSNTIQNNIVSQNGTSSLTGTYGGIQIGLSGGSSAGAQSTTVTQNQVYKNIGPGISVFITGSKKNLITQNSIYNNGNASDATGKLRLGIDLDGNNMTANDYQDPDNGPNGYSNFPIITGAIPGGTSCSELLKGTFNGLPSTQYYVEVFSNDVCNGDTAGIDYYTSSGNNYGEGKTYLGVSSTFTTDASGNGNWTVPVTFSAVFGKYVTATAIQASGTDANSTSEFSQCYYIMYDCGDAPDSYKTLLSSCGPIHLNQNANIKIGSTIDADNDGVPTVNADGDGADEDGVSTLPAITTLSTSYTISNIPVTNSTGSAATLYAWIDFNVNGSFQASEFTSVSVPSSGAQTVNLTWSSLSCGSNLLPGISYLRMRLTTTALTDVTGTASVDERSYGEANDGEVEDYYLYINGVDFGDLSNTHPTATALSLANTATSKVWAGVTKPSMECTQKFSADAQGDGAEEDGLTTGIGPWGSSYNWVIRLNANQAGKTVYYGLWLDWNGNGSFIDGVDAFYSGSASVTGTTNVNVSVFSSYSMTYSSAFRLIVSDVPLTSGMFNATIANGEVEDYLVLTILADPGNILNGKKQSTGNLLKWKNKTALPVTSFIVERSINNLTWTTLGAVNPLPGNSSSTEYSFSDFKPEVQNYYRLKLQLSDGTYQYSNILPIFDNNNSLPVMLFPNPAVNTLAIQTANSNYIGLKIFDLTGRLQLSEQINSLHTTIDISNLASGTHVIKFYQKNGTEEVQRFVKIK